LRALARAKSILSERKVSEKGRPVENVAVDDSAEQTDFDL
jgi:hypothetical protein